MGSIHESTHGLADVQRFIAGISAPGGAPEVRFDRSREIYVARAPGRLDLMGGIADYSGSLVLQLPIAEAALAALQRDPSRTLTLVSLSAENRREFSMCLDDFLENSQPVDYRAAASYFRRDPSQRWAAYVAGAFLVLMRERGVRFEEGARLLLNSAVPEGKGVSSSAAIEVAVMQAIATAYKVDLSPRDMALLCQKAENLVVGAPCGVMDQMTAVCGEKGSLLALLCQPAELLDPLSIPEGMAVWGIDSGIRHSVSGADYTSVRVGAFMGYRMICEMAGLKSRKNGKLIEIDDPLWRGYLANVEPAEFERDFAAKLPDHITGAEFLARYGGVTDPVTQIDAARTYAVRAPTAHPVYEHFRVRTFAGLLRQDGGHERMERLGELMYQSHASYSACELGSDGTDLLVNLVREAGAKQGLYGAKITGGGSGGTVAVLGRSGADESIERVAAEYLQKTGHKPHVFRGSSPGAASFGCLKLNL